MHNPKDLNCQCSFCRFQFAEADDLAAEFWKSIVPCKRPGCTHNNCLMVEGICAGNCPCAKEGGGR